jgi:predicted metal-dependent RNase
MTKRRASDELEGLLEEEDVSHMVTITPLGAGQEVGRSSIILKYMYVLAA